MGFSNLSSKYARVRAFYVFMGSKHAQQSVGCVNDDAKEQEIDCHRPFPPSVNLMDVCFNGHRPTKDINTSCPNGTIGRTQITPPALTSEPSATLHLQDSTQSIYCAKQKRIALHSIILKFIPNCIPNHVCLSFTASLDVSLVVVVASSTAINLNRYLENENANLQNERSADWNLRPVGG